MTEASVANGGEPRIVGAVAELVSLVMPVWRPRPEWLRESVRSALDQRGCAVELIVVDDGSPEPVSALLEGVADERLRIIRIDHQGTSAARNAGIAESRGDWLRFVDYDDVLPPESTAHLLALAGTPAVIPYGATEICDEELEPRSKMRVDMQGMVVRECLLDRFDVTLPALLFPRWVVERVGDWETSIVVCQDWDFILRALEHAPVRGDDTTVLLYRKHRGGASAGALGSAESLRLAEEGMRRVMDRYFERHPEKRGTELERRARARVELVMARAHRETYLAYLGHALRGDTAGVVRELLVFARLVARRSLRQLAWRARRSSPSAGTVASSSDTDARIESPGS